jgi:hypothetical protein
MSSFPVLGHALLQKNSDGSMADCRYNIKFCQDMESLPSLQDDKTKAPHQHSQNSKIRVHTSKLNKFLLVISFALRCCLDKTKF